MISNIDDAHAVLIGLHIVVFVPDGVAPKKGELCRYGKKSAFVKLKCTSFATFLHPCSLAGEIFSDFTECTEGVSLEDID